jgi:ATP-dependent Clp protease protease subunit
MTEPTTPAPIHPSPRNPISSPKASETPPPHAPMVKPESPANPPLPNFPIGTIYINYHDVVTDAKVRGLMALCSDILAKVQPRPSTFYFAISSPGGSVAAGITFYNFLRGLPVRVVMHNSGSVDSIATVIFLAGEERYACSHSRFLFHGIGTELPAKARINQFQMRELLSSLDQDENRINELVAERSKLTKAEMLRLFQQGETKDPAFALEKGIIDDIRDLAFPSGAQIITPNFQ